MNNPIINKGSLLQSKRMLSGEISKEPFLDILLTTLEQSSFSLSKRNENLNYVGVKFLKQAQGNTRKAYNQASLGFKLATSLYSQSYTKNVGTQISYPKLRLGKKVKIGDYVYYGDKIGHLGKKAVVIPESGKIIKISQTQITIQKTQPVLFYSQAEIHVKNNEWVKRGSPILTLAHQTLVTGDIVQGIPRIEQLFEASTSYKSSYKEFTSRSAGPGIESNKATTLSDAVNVSSPSLQTSSLNSLTYPSSTSLPSSHLAKKNKENRAVFEKDLLNKANMNDKLASIKVEMKPSLFLKTLQSQVRETFRKNWNQFPLPIAVRQSLEEIQQIIVESIQKVYISQGVLIADKHIEIVVRQMTSKAQIFDGGSTGLLIDEILSLQQIENANISTPGQKALYIPVIMGLTPASLSSDSFVSAASFQETTRVLSRDAVAGKSDFLRGLKEKVIIGDLIDAGTGLDLFYIYSLFSTRIFQNKMKDIFNRKVTHKTLKKLVNTISKS